MQNDKIYAKKGEIKLGYYSLKRMLYWFGCLNAILVLFFSNAKRVFVNDTGIIKIYVTVESDQACFAMFVPLSHDLTFLICSFSYEFQSTGQFRLHKPNHNQSGIFYKPCSVDVE